MEPISAQRVKPRVLLVDDNRVTLALMSSSLEELGCKVLSAKNGHEALEILHSEKSIDIVVTDLGMPVMDGLELLRLLRESEKLMDLPVILLSGDADEATMKKATEHKHCRYLVKPVLPDFLFEQIVAMLSHAEMAPQPT